MVFIFISAIWTSDLNIFRHYSMTFTGWMGTGFMRRKLESSLETVRMSFTIFFWCPAHSWIVSAESILALTIAMRSGSKLGFASWSSFMDVEIESAH